MNFPPRPPRQFFLWTTLAVVVFVLDILSKQIVLASSLADAPVVLLPFFRLVMVENSGAAFGFLADGGAAARAFLILVPVAVCAGLAAYLWLAKPHGAEALGCALVLGGALGNLKDRIARGKVVDFLDLHIQQWHWPAFNLADAAITAGTALLVVNIIFFQKPRKAL